jgi:hypothetical protein
MTEKDLREFKEALKGFRAKNAATREQARRLLREEGVITSKGKLTKRYSRKLATAS